MDLHYQLSSWSALAVDRHLAGLADTFQHVVERARAEGKGTAVVVDAITRERFAGAAG